MTWQQQILGLGLLCLTAGTSIGQSVKPTSPVSVIFDTDMGPDYDDVGAITLLHAYADAGKARILATIASTNYPNVVPVLSVLNTYFNRPNIPVGVVGKNGLGDHDGQHWSDTLVDRYPHQLRMNSDAADAVALYRQVLAREPDHSVTIITVGFLTNLATLLQSKADAYSPVSGLELVRRKVKRLVSMAGKFPAGREFNVFRDATASQTVFSKWPTPILFSGFEIGERIHSGLPLIQNEQIRHSPVKDVFSIAIPKSADDCNGRMSWDQTAVLVGVEGTDKYFSLQNGRIVVASDGSNKWDPAGSGQAYLVEKVPLAVVEKRINDLMQHQPKK